MRAPLPANESERLATLRGYRVLDTTPEQSFDDIAQLASFICGTPVALISLVDEHRQWFKSRIGVETQETPREIAFCAHAILGDDLFIVPDAERDARFAENPLVTHDPKIRFYAGMPLTTPGGHNVGTLCVVDRTPRDLSEEQRQALRALGRQVITLLEQRRRAGELSALAQEQYESERRLAAQYAIVRVLAEAPSIEEALPRILQAVCESLNWEHGGVWRVDRSANLLRCLHTWHPADIHFPEFEELSRNSAFAPGVGLPGRVWKSGEPHWVPDVTQDMNFPRAPIAAREGLRAALGFPLRVGEEVFGVMEFFSREVRQPDDSILQMMATVGSQIGQFIERKRAESELDEFFQLSQDLLCVTGFDGYFKRLNQSWEEVFQYSREELLARPFIEFVHPDDVEKTSQAFAQALRGTEVLSFQNRFVRKDGTARWLEWNAIPVPEQQLIYAVGRDITDRKRADEARSHLAAIVESSGDAIASTDMSGVINSWNAGAERLFGYTAAEAIGRHFRMLVPSDRHERADVAIEAIRHGSGVLNLEREGIRKDGSRVPVSLTVSPIRNAQGEVTGVSSISRDISDRLRWAAELQQAKEAAESANRAKSDFLANMSHEIRTPMNAIIGMTELALDTELTPEQREYLAAVQDAAESLLALINDILDFSKIEAGMLQLEETIFSLRDLVADSMRVLGLRAHRKGLELACDVRPGVPERVVGDPTRLRQVLVNLVGNAIKFTEHGEVVVHVEKKLQDEISVLLHFAVADTGIGIPRDKQQEIFRSFVQADSSTTRKYGGTGLGLSISQKLIAMMGGTIELESEPGLGSTFHFTARFAKPLGGFAETPLEELIALRGLRVLVVDDSATNRRILCEMLEQWEMKPVPAKGVREALDVLHAARRTANPFSLVLTDANMPEQDGFALAEKIHAHPEFARAIVMMLTSGGRAGDLARCRELGMAAYLLKPVKQSDLLDAILTALSSRREARARKVPAHARGKPPARRSLHVLVAEDHPVNQELVARILEKRGHTWRIAKTGKEALEFLAGEKFDVVLMDAQMPEMNGLEATRLHREREKSTGEHVPIFALTAHALAGDRERCLEAGMDGYLAKPVNSHKLISLVETMTGISDAPIAQDAEAASASAIFDQGELSERTGGNTALMKRVARIFLHDYPAKLRAIERSILRRDASALARAAHALKGSAATLAAHATASAARALEDLGNDGDLARGQDLLSQLKSECGRFAGVLRSSVLKEKSARKAAEKKSRPRSRAKIRR